jgi:hypothetical protein
LNATRVLEEHELLGTDDITWFKDAFYAEITAATAGTRLTTDILAALACQEPGEIWPIVRRAKLPTDKNIAVMRG